MSGGCYRAAPTEDRTAPRWIGEDVDALDKEARGILADALTILRTFDTQAAFRVSVSPLSGLRSVRELPWEPVPPSTWRETRAAATQLRTRAISLYGSASRSAPAADVWRDRRERAEGAQALTRMAEALDQYGTLYEALETEVDGGSALPLLARAWQHWERGAAYWGASRWELIEC